MIPGPGQVAQSMHLGEPRCTKQAIHSGGVKQTTRPPPCREQSRPSDSAGDCHSTGTDQFFGKKTWLSLILIHDGFQHIGQMWPACLQQSALNVFSVEMSSPSRRCFHGSIVTSDLLPSSHGSHCTFCWTTGPRQSLGHREWPKPCEENVWKNSPWDLSPSNLKCDTWIHLIQAVWQSQRDRVCPSIYLYIFYLPTRHYETLSGLATVVLRTPCHVTT